MASPIATVAPRLIAAQKTAGLFSTWNQSGQKCLTGAGFDETMPHFPRIENMEMPSSCAASGARRGKFRELRLLENQWYPRPDSNRHALRREILNLLRLPFRHLGTWRVSSAHRVARQG
tara:strand:+ start:2983 stop:3339 length:357 start_codon:yes stop_codon:yes gene_type:complete